MIPLLTLASSMKLTFVVSSIAIFLSSRSILSLSAPGAFSLFVPCALSRSEVSFVDEINSSLICRPTLYEGLPEYFSRTIVCLSTTTKNPLVKTTPSCISAIEARPEGVSPDATVLK